MAINRNSLAELISPTLGNLFTEADANTVLAWIGKSASKRLVVVVGAGFSKNSVLSSTGKSAADLVPIWEDIISSLRNDLGLKPSETYDDLLIADLYCDSFGRAHFEHKLLELFPDDKLAPGVAHHALFNLPSPAGVITTNQLDTLLERWPPSLNPRKWHRIVEHQDMGRLPQDAVELIYLHGHRSRPDTWVFSRTDYEKLDDTRPFLMWRVRHLFAQHPVLFIGFGLTDPNLHSIARYISSKTGDYQPPMLAIVVKDQPPSLRQHWQRLGVSVAIINSTPDLNSTFFSFFRGIEKAQEHASPEDIQLRRRTRFLPSEMDRLVEKVSSCELLNGKLHPCRYHHSRFETAYVQLAAEADGTNISAARVRFEQGPSLRKIFEQMDRPIQPAGSWGLMPSHRKWLKDMLFKVLTRHGKGGKEIRILQCGIAGHVHHYGNLKIIQEVLQEVGQSTNVHLTTFDRCVGPLLTVDYFRRKRKQPPKKLPSVAAISGCNITIDRSFWELWTETAAADLVFNQHLEQRDVLELQPLEEENEKYDVVIAHHLVTTWDKDQEDQVRLFARSLTGVTIRGGYVLMAVGSSDPDSCLTLCHSAFEKAGFTIYDALLTFDIYDLAEDERHEYLATSDRPLVVCKETYLVAYIRLP